MSEFKNMPKVELHLHLDGSLSTEDVMKKYGLSEDQMKEKMVADEKCKDLNDYLTKFDFPISIMQTKEELTQVTVDLLNKLKSQNVIYVEIRFAPQFHTQKGLSQEEVVQTVIEAKEQVDIKANFILCFMRGADNMKANLETLEVAKKYLRKGVCAVDLAGAEAIFKTSGYKEIFAMAKEAGVPYTIHAGEADGPESIKAAIEFGTKRIGHGVRSIEDEELLKYIVANEIYLEVCPTSNIQTCICDSYATHPVEKLYKMGAKVTLNTDNMTVSNTNLENEYVNLVNSTSITKEDIIAMNINSVNAAFITKEEKEELIARIKMGE